MGSGRSLFTLAILLAVAAAIACDPVSGTGSGHPLSPNDFTRIDTAQQTMFLTLQPGYTASDYQSNFNGWQYGQLIVSVPIGWRLTVDCINRGRVPNSCAIVGSGSATTPLESDWATPDYARGLAPGASASFTAQLSRPGRYRLADLVPGRESAGAWAELVVITSGPPSVVASGAG